MTTARAGWWAQVPDHLVLTDAWGRGEHLVALPDPLGLSRRCPRAGRCEVCDATRKLEATTYQTPVRLFSATVCDQRVAAGNPPMVRSWAGAVERVLAHCQHLDLDVGEMGAVLYGEFRGGGDGWV
jgi:hypothetical protein